MHLFLGGFFGGWLQYLMGWFTRFHYIAPFIVLMLCGLGAPLPEEVTLIGCGYLVHLKLVHFWPISAVCVTAILLGDSIPYWLGRHYGLAALKTRWVAKVLHPERFAKLERRFEDNKNWSIFTCRFLPGLRIPGYFVAGTLRMSFTRFIVLDTIGVLLSVPTSIWVAKFVFRNIEGDEGFGEAGKSVSRLNHYLLIALAVLFAVLYVRNRIRKRNKVLIPAEPLPQVIDPLIEARRYPEALKLVPDMDAHVGALVLESESDIRRLEGEGAHDGEPAIDVRRSKLRQDLARLYEALLGSARLEEAGRLAERALGLDGRAATYTAFLQAALRAQAPAAARSVAGRADDDPRLSADEKVAVRSVAREILQPG